MRVTTPTHSASNVEIVSTHEIGFYAQLVSERFAPLTITSDHPSRFRGTIRGRCLGEVEVFDVRANQHRVERPQPLATRTPQHSYMLHLQLSGVGLITQDGREAQLHPGDLAFYDSDHAYSLDLDDQFRNIILVFPQRLLTLPQSLTHEMTATPILGSQQLTQLAGTFMTQLACSLDSMPIASGRRVARTAVDLISTLIHAELGVTALEHAAGQATTPLYDRVRSYIEDHLSDPHLNPQMIADAHFVSVRTLHALFSKQGDMSVAAYIRARRLELCRQDLSSRLQDRLPISTLAERYGFVNPPHFSRLFKSEFGLSPTEFRRYSQEQSRVL